MSSFDLQFRSDRNRRLQSPVHGTFVVKDPVHPLRRPVVFVFAFQLEPHVNAPQNQHIVLFLDLTGRLARQASLAGRNFTRLQRASKGAGESTRSSRDDVIERRRVWFQVRRRCLEIVRGYRAMDPEQNRVWFRRNKGSAQRALYALDADFGSVHDVAHCRIVPPGDTM
jgi:hypothetical protein